MRVETSLRVARVQSQLRGFDVDAEMTSLVQERADDVLGLLGSADVPHRDVQIGEQAASAKLQRFGFGNQMVARGRRPRTRDA
jgi:hypothetical protein